MTAQISVSIHNLLLILKKMMIYFHQALYYYLVILSFARFLHLLPEVTEQP